MHCAGSVQRSAGMPVGIQSGYALDGTEAHELLEYALVNEIPTASEALIKSGIKWTHRHDTESDRLDSVQLMLDHIQDLIKAYEPDLRVYLECQFTFPTSQSDDAGGTSDVVIYVPDLDMMLVNDFKHGAGQAVDVEENSQLLFYAAGVRHELRHKGLATSGKTAYRLGITQPRAFHKAGAIREWITDDDRLDRFIGEVDAAIIRSKSPVPTYKPGEWCRWCPAFNACPEAAADRISKVLPTYHTMDDVRARGLPDLSAMNAEQLAQIIEASGMLEEYLNSAKALALSLARQGVEIPRHKVVMAQARRKWHGDTREIAISLAHIVGIQDPKAFMPPTLVTITEAERLIKQAIYQRVGKGKLARDYVADANAAMAPLTIKDTSGNLVLVSRDDKRPEANIVAAIPYVRTSQP